MLLKFRDELLEIPMTYSMSLSNQSQLVDTIIQIIERLKKYWATNNTYENWNTYHGYNFIIKSFKERKDSDFINRCLEDYFLKEDKSIFGIETFIKCITSNKEWFVLSDSVFILIHECLLAIYQNKIEVWDKKYFDDDKIYKIFVEHVLYMLTMLVEQDFYLSVKEWHLKYSKLYFPYIFNAVEKTEIKVLPITESTLTNFISKLKHQEEFASHIIEYRVNGKKYNYVDLKFIEYYESQSSAFKNIELNLKDYIKKRNINFDKVRNITNNIFLDYRVYLDLKDREIASQWVKLLDSYYKQTLRKVIFINLLEFIINDLMERNEISTNFSTLESVFYAKYNDYFSVFSREEMKKNYYKVTAYLMLLINRKQFGRMNIDFFDRVCQSEPRFKDVLDEIRPIFHGTKGKSKFSKTFEVFIETALFPDIRNHLTDTKEWKNIKKFIKEKSKNINSSYEYSIMLENLETTTRAISKFNRNNQQNYSQQLKELEGVVYSISDSPARIISWLTEPVSQEEFESPDAIFIRFSTKGVEITRGIDGELKKLNSSTVNEFLPETEGQYKFFKNKLYRYTVTMENNKQVTRLIKFFNFEHGKGKYKVYEHDFLYKVGANISDGTFVLDVIRRKLILDSGLFFHESELIRISELQIDIVERTLSGKWLIDGNNSVPIIFKGVPNL